MKKMKRVFALLLALVMVLAMGATAFAADTYTITITPNADDAGTHTYEAYQLFKGDLVKQDGKKILTNITWGDNIDTTKLATLAQDINTLNAETADYTALTASSTAEAFADAISGLNAAHDSAAAQAVADAFAKVLKGTPAGTGAAGTNKIEGLSAGYYLVKDKDGTQDGKEDAAYTRYILQVLDDVTIEAKSEVPSVDKKIVNGENRLSATSASIGDTIPYEVTSTVPDMTGYNKYFFVLNDTMSKGLTFNDDVAITIGTKTLVKDTDFTVEAATDSDTGVTTVKIVLKNFIQYQTSQPGKAIKVTYSATLNENADLTATGNVNEVELTYSNNPNHDYTGTPEKPDEPGPNEPVGETPEVTTKTFTTGVKLIKVDAEDPTRTLTGAKFSIAGTKLKVTLINQEVFELDADGEYYMLTDGTYTKTAPTDETKDNYDSTEKKYTKVEHVVKTTQEEPVTAEGYVKSDGTLTFEGLAAGTYTITELVPPEGFNLLKTPITLVIDGTLDQTAKTCTWSATANGEDAAYVNNLVQLTVENKAGNEMPSTGGIGTTIFYVAGAVLAVGACILLIARRRVRFE